MSQMMKAKHPNPQGKSLSLFDFYISLYLGLYINFINYTLFSYRFLILLCAVTLFSSLMIKLHQINNF